MKTNTHFLFVSRSVLLSMRNVTDRSCSENRNTHYVFIFLAYYAWPRTYPSRSWKRNPWREHVQRATRRRSQAIDMAWRHVALATTRITWHHVAMVQEIVSRHKHNMLSLLYATCLKLLVFFFRKYCRLWDNVENIVKPDRPQKTVWLMRISCWIPKATNALTYLLHGAGSFLRS